MVEIFIAIVIGFILGAVSGAFSAFLGWIKSGDVFEPKKFVLGTVTGIIAGIVLVQGAAASIEGAATDQALLFAYIAIVLSIVGVDQLRTSISGAVANRAESEPAPTVK